MFLGEPGGSGIKLEAEEDLMQESWGMRGNGVFLAGEQHMAGPWSVRWG